MKSSELRNRRFCAPVEVNCSELSQEIRQVCTIGDENQVTILCLELEPRFTRGEWVTISWFSVPIQEDADLRPLLPRKVMSLLSNVEAK